MQPLVTGDGLPLKPVGATSRPRRRRKAAATKRPR
jgi:hypothetical protein